MLLDTHSRRADLLEIEARQLAEAINGCDPVWADLIRKALRIYCLVSAHQLNETPGGTWALASLADALTEGREDAFVR